MDALNNKLYFIDSTKHKIFVEQIINGMHDWVRVIDINDNIIFVNESMAKALGKNVIGEKCYEAIGKSEPCENCTSRKAVFEGTIQAKEEIIGDRIFSVKSSPIRMRTAKLPLLLKFSVT